MSPLSNDLRERIVATVQAGRHTITEVARLFLVNVSTVVRLLQRFRQTGSIEPKPHAGGARSKLDGDAEKRLLELVEIQPDATLAELRDRLGIDCSITAIFRALQRKKITRKKKTYHAEEQDSPRVQQQRNEFQEKMATVDPAHVVFVDETGATTAMNRTYGRAPMGERVQATAPGGWHTVTLILGLRTEGVVAPMAVPGSTDQAAFDTYVTQVLAPTLQPGDIVVWDHLSAHGSAKAKKAIEAMGATLMPLPVYSPDMSPIEELFSKVKAGLRTIAARTVETVIAAMGNVLNTVTKSDILGWFNDRFSYATQT